MNSILAILSTILIIGGISSAYSESISSQLERRLPYDQIQCDKLDHVFIGAHITGSYACIHKKVAEEFKIPSFYNVTIGDRFGMIRYSNMTFEYNSTQNIVTEDFNFKKTDILESNKTNLLTNIGDAILPDGPILDYYQHFWPQYTMIFPKQVQVGEPFNVVLDYTFVLPSIEYVNNTGIEVWGNNSDLQCPASKCETHSLYQCILNGCYGYNFDIVTSSNVDLLNESNYVLGKVFHGKYDAEYIVEDKFNVVDLTVDKYRNHGYVLRPYNNTYPQQENFTFVINTPTTDNYGIIAIGHQIREHNSLFHFYIAPNNTVYLTTSPDYAPWEGWNNLKKPILNYGYYPPFIFVHPMGDIPFMKDFIQKNYPDADIEQKLRDMDQPEEIIEQFFSVYPELQKKSPQTCISCTQISEQIPSPKKQIDNGVAPHDVICKDGLVLVDRGADKIACIKKTSIQNTHWNLIEKPYFKLANSEINTTSVQNTLSKNASLNNMYPYDVKSHIPPTFHPLWEGNFSITVPSSVLVNETFDLEYTWTKRINLTSERYFPSCDTAPKYIFCSTSSDMDNIAIFIHSDLEFINTSKIPIKEKCFIAITDDVDIMSENKYDRSDKFILKFTKIPNPNRGSISIVLLSAHHSLTIINTTDNGNGTINLDVIGSNDQVDLPYDYCSVNDSPQGNNSSIVAQPIPESTIDLKPDCIDKRFWRGISEKDRNNILNNSTTCQIINNTQITNLPPIGYQLMPKVAFEGLERLICHNYGGNLEAMILDGGFTDPVWIKDFKSYFDHLTEQSCKIILNDYV